MSTTNPNKNNESSDPRKSLNPTSTFSRKNTEKSKDPSNKMNNELKMLSDHINLTTKKTSLINGNLESIFSNILVWFVGSQLCGNFATTRYVRAIHPPNPDITQELYLYNPRKISII